MTGASPIPDEFNNDVMAMMVEHAKNTRMEVRISQPPLVRAGSQKICCENVEWMIDFVHYD